MKYKKGFNYYEYFEIHKLIINPKDAVEDQSYRFNIEDHKWNYTTHGSVVDKWLKGIPASCSPSGEHKKLLEIIINTLSIRQIDLYKVLYGKV